MKYYIGIDGGGSKTSVAIGDSKGKLLKSTLYPGCSYQEIGIDAVVSLISKSVKEIIVSINADFLSCAGCCIGLPCFGENTKKDIVIKEKIENELYPIPIYIVNDGVVGWAGSLNCNEGIHLVAGTGAIAIGCNANGEIVRCGGWNELFGDEGSCYWIGKKVMQLFSKEADGRIPKSNIYYNIRKKYHLKNDFDFIELMTRDVLPYRDKVALFQKNALEAADAGDMEVIRIYESAAKELAELIGSIKKQLSWKKEPIRVSYYGGLFHAGKYVLPKLKQELEKMNCLLQEPIFTATEGALLLAVKNFKEEELHE